MKSISSKFVLFTTKINPHVRLAILIATLILFVLAAGAPCAPGSVGG
jgi:hypothetical protein